MTSSGDGRDAPDLLGLRENVPLAPRTTLRLGGPARFFVEATSADGVRRALRAAREARIPVALLGEGSNVVVPDAGFPGLVVRIALPGIVFGPRDAPAGAGSGERVRVRAGAGVHWDDLVRASVGRGLSGIECLSGIPGTVGAAPMQNIGAYGQELEESCRAVRCLDRERLEIRSFDAAACGFAYRHSRFKGEDRGRYVVLGLTLELRAGRRPALRYGELADAVGGEEALEGMAPADAVARIRRAVLELRRGKAMLADPDDPDARSAGSFFLNPVLDDAALGRLRERCRALGVEEPPPTYPAEGGTKVPAAWLVEHAGFRKGHRHGGVGISERHALALVNRDGTTAELLELAGRIQGAVEERFGVRLEREPVLLEP